MLSAWSHDLMALVSKMIWCDHGWMPYYYGFCPNEKVWHKEMKRLGQTDIPYPASTACVTFMENKKDRNKRVAIVTVAKRAPQDIVELLVHEAMHVWRDIRNTIGEAEPSSEFEAYAMQNIISELMYAYQKTRGCLFLKGVK
jgi:hypothetical protein